MLRGNTAVLYRRREPPQRRHATLFRLPYSPKLHSRHYFSPYHSLTTNAASNTGPTAVLPVVTRRSFDIVEDYDAVFNEHLNTLKREGRYREFKTITRRAGHFPTAIQSESVFTLDDAGTKGFSIDSEVYKAPPMLKNPGPVVSWCSNDYLGMGQHPHVLAAMRQALNAHGAGSGGTRNISGTNMTHVRLENILAEWHDKEAALVFANCFSANQWSIIALAKLLPGLVILSDEENHASLIEGIRHSGAKKHIFRHNDLVHLESLLSAYTSQVPKLIIFESVYSMDGSVAPITDLVRLAKKYAALTFIDEVHAVGLYGDSGAGVAERDGVMKDLDIISGTLGKAVGVFGGYVAASRNIIDVIRSSASGFIFTTSLPPVVCAGAVASVACLQTNVGRRLRDIHKQKTAYLKSVLTASHLPVHENPTHIVPVMVGNAFKCKRMADNLLQNHRIYVQPINFPTVAIGTERFRLTPSPVHTQLMIMDLKNALVQLWTAEKKAEQKRTDKKIEEEAEEDPNVIPCNPS